MSKYRKLAGKRLASWVTVLLARILPRLEAANKLDKALISLLSVARTIPYAEEHRLQLERLLEVIRSNHPCIGLARRLVREVHPNFIVTFIRNLWVNFWLNGQIMQEFRMREGFEPPHLAVISPLKDCNLQCVGCYASAVRSGDAAGEGRLDFETMDRIVTELRTYGTQFIVFTGGEPTHPLIWEDIKRICEKHKEQAFMMYTNGTLLDDQKVRDLVELGNLSPAISIEGWEKETDERRGRGVFKKVVEAMDRLREAGVLFGFSLTYTSRNFEAATDPALIDFLTSKGALYGWYFMYVPVGKDPDVSLVVEPWQRDKIRQFTWDMLCQKGVFIADFWNSGAMAAGCIAGSRYLHIDNRGAIEPCVFFKFSTMNIRDHKIIDALRSPFFRLIREGQRHQCNPLTPCQFMDNPECGRRAVLESGAKASEPGGEELFGKLMPFLQEYSTKYREEFALKAWEETPTYEYFRRIFAGGEWREPIKCRHIPEREREEIRELRERARQAQLRT